MATFLWDKTNESVNFVYIIEIYVVVTNRIMHKEEYKKGKHKLEKYKLA